MFNYRNRYLTVLPVLLFSAVSQGAIVSTTTADSGGADTLLDGVNPSANYGSAAALPLDTRGSTVAVALEFNTGNVQGLRDSASLTYWSKKNGTTALSVYGVRDGDPAEAWSEGTLTYAGQTWLIPDPNTAGAIIADPNDTVALGTISVNVGAAAAPYTFTSDALSRFVAADTNGVITLLLLPTSTKGANPFYTKETSAAVAPSLAFDVPDTTPEPACLGSLLFASGLILRRRRR